MKLKIKQNDLVLIDYFYSNKLSSKPRPAIVVSKDFYNFSCKDVVIAPLTSNLTQSHIYSIISNKDLISGELKKMSLIRADGISLYNKKLIIEKIGEVNENILRNIKEDSLKILF